MYFNLHSSNLHVGNVFLTSLCQLTYLCSFAFKKSMFFMVLTPATFSFATTSGKCFTLIYIRNFSIYLILIPCYLFEIRRGASVRKNIDPFVFSGNFFFELFSDCGNKRFKVIIGTKFNPCIRCNWIDIR